MELEKKTIKDFMELTPNDAINSNFKTDWNCLITMVLKCNEKQIFGSQHLINAINDALLTCDNETTFNACMDFIIWFNYNSK